MKKIIIILSTILLIVDFIIKYMVTNFMMLHQSIKIIPNFLDITYIKNLGGAFNILEGNKWFFIIIAVVSLVFIVKYIFMDRNITKIDAISYSLIFSGIVGNLFDRIIYGGVIDYIHFNIFGNDMPIFNFSDMCIVFGVIMVMYILIFKGDINENIYSRK